MWEGGRAFSRGANWSKNCSSVSSCSGEAPLFLSRVSMKHFMIMLPCVGLGRSAPGRQHRHTISITAIIFAEEIDQISLFQEDANTDVGRGCSREQQMPDGHRGRHPEADDAAEIGRVSNQLIEHRRSESLSPRPPPAAT